MKACLLVALCSLTPFAGSARAAMLLSENFDGGSVNSTFAYTNSGGGAPATVNVGGANSNVARITNLNASNNNSIAWNAVAVAPTPVLRLGFDFSATDDATNGSNGGCCGEAADGFAIGFFPTAAYGSTGGVNPALAPVAFNWEDGVITGVPALLVGFDIFDGGGPQGNNVSLAWNGTILTDQPVAPVLNNNLFHRALLTITDTGANSVLSFSIDGTTIYSGITATGVDLDSVGSNFRLIAGGRTGAAFSQVQLDNVFVEAIPEPSLGVLTVAGFAGLMLRRRRA
jgi:hypothetical protein